MATDTKTLQPIDAEIVERGTSFTTVTHHQKGSIFIRFSEVTASKHSIECIVKIDVRADGELYPSYTQRIDLRSSSARKGLATDLNAAFGDKKAGLNWVLILNVAFNRIVDEINKSQQPTIVTGLKAEEPSFLLRPFLQERAPNLLFAASEAGKTWLAIHMAACVASGKPFLGFSPTKKGKTLYLDYEDDTKTFVSRLHKIARGMDVPFDELADSIHYYQPLSSLRVMVEPLKVMLEKHKYDLIIIDAGGDAAGGSPSDEEKVLDFFNALNEIPTTKLILHHEPKYVVSENAAFYGSQYWKARSRVAWRLEVQSDEEGAAKQIKATIQKRSNLPFYPAIYYDMAFEGPTFDDYIDGALPPLGPLSVSFSLTDASELVEKTVDEQILETLDYGPMIAEQVADKLKKVTGYIRKRLSILEAEGKIRATTDSQLRNKKWERV